MAKKKESEGALVPHTVEPRMSEAEALITRAIDNNLPVETMERLLAMRTQIKAEQAREAYNRAMAGFQGECPAIKKTKEVRTNTGALAYKYAPIESIVSQVQHLLQKYGFSYSTIMELQPEGVRVIVRVTHIDGHCEEYPMEVPFGSKTQIMSQTQVVAAASTFAKRYAFCNAFGILTGDEDTDAAPQKESKEKYDTSPVAARAKVTVTGTDTDEDGIPEDEIKQKQIILGLLRNHQVDIGDADEIKWFVENETELELVPQNFKKIIKILGNLKK